MGGAALGQKAPRLPRDVYSKIVAELKAKLVPVFYLLLEEPRSFTTKTSFGDVDLLAAKPQRRLDPKQDLGSLESGNNGNIKHFEYEGYQIDVIEIDEDHFELGRFFYGYGDTGMITGMFTRNIGLKFGMGGLTYKCETYKIKLSHDLRAILQFLGLDYDAWLEGFDTQEDLFRFMESSKYFRPYFFSRKHPAVFELDVQKRTKGNPAFETPTIWNHEARHRMAERPMFHSWIEYVESLPESAHDIDPEQVKASALTAFGKQAELQEVEEGLDLGRRVKAKFNGKHAMVWTDNQVMGKPLGELTASFKTVYPMKQLDKMTQDEIREAFIKFYTEQR